MSMQERSQPIRVVQVLEATTGGTARHLSDLCDALPAEEFEVRVVCSTGRSASFEQDIAAWRQRGIDVRILPMLRRPAPLSDMRAVIRLRRLLRDEPCDILHLHSSKAGIVGRLAARCLPCRVLYSPHCFGFLQDWPWPLRALFRATERLAARWQNHFVAVGRGELELARAEGLLGAGEPILLPNAVDLVQARKFERRSEPDCVGLIGSLRTQKDPHTFFAAANHLASSAQSARFLMPADGPLLANLRAAATAAPIAGRVEFVPMAEIYARAAVAVLPSRWEGLPYTLLDVMALGLPVVAAGIPPLAERLGRIDDRLLFPPRDADALASRLKQLLADPAWARSLGERGRALVEAEHGLENWGERVRDTYRRLVPD